MASLPRVFTIGRAGSFPSMNAVRLLDSPIAFHRCLAELTGSAAAGLLLSQAIYWNNRCQREDGWWWKTADEWRAETYLGPKEFQTAKKACSKFLESEVRGMPARTWYRLRVNELQEALERLPDGENKFSRNGETGLAETAKLDWPKRRIHRTETTPEITPENISAPPAAEKVYPAQARELVAKFGDAFQKRFGCVYQPSRSDLVAARVLCASGVSTDEALRVAEAGWSSGKFWGSRVATVVMLRTRWNEIRAELPVVHAGGEDWAAEVRAASKGGAA